MNADELIIKIENILQRWHLGREDDEQTLYQINEAMFEAGLLRFENKNKESKNDEHS